MRGGLGRTLLTAFLLLTLGPLTVMSLFAIQRMQDGQAANPESLAATLVAAALIVALVTTIAAAFITRLITRPLYDLTQSAVNIAKGDLKTRATITQENELGILALAFNAMTDQLQESMQTLEQKVEERTEQLRQANAEIAHRAWQLEVGAEIGKALTVFHELEELLKEGCERIQEAFGFLSVSAWLTGRRREQRQLALRAVAPATAEAEHRAMHGWLMQSLHPADGTFSPDLCTLALPLRIADNHIGVLVICAESPFTADDQHPLQMVADTFAVAIENARAAEVEHEALLKLKQLETHRSESLGQMSHDLSTSLNTIIGYSSLLLRENSGPLNEMQRSDLSYINRNGVQLLTLLDGMLELIDESANGDEPPPSGK
jgi:nitrate/nitrite-specific signal transduction histidine kinase